MTVSIRSTGTSSTCRHRVCKQPGQSGDVTPAAVSEADTICWHFTEQHASKTLLIYILSASSNWDLNTDLNSELWPSDLVLVLVRPTAVVVISVKVCCHRDSNCRSPTWETGMLTNTPRQLTLPQNLLNLFWLSSHVGSWLYDFVYCFLTWSHVVQIN